jgi:hypothetical protein
MVVVSLVLSYSGENAFLLLRVAELSQPFSLSSF